MDNFRFSVEQSDPVLPTGQLTATVLRNAESSGARNFVTPPDISQVTRVRVGFTVCRGILRIVCSFPRVDVLALPRS